MIDIALRSSVQLNDGHATNIYDSVINVLEKSFNNLPTNIKLKDKYQRYLNFGDTHEVAFRKALQSTLVLIDSLLNKELNIIIHHPQYQSLEASWRGLYYLVHETPKSKSIKIKVLDLSWTALAKDLKLAIEFDQSVFFKKVYSEEFDRPGGEPFGLLIGDYFVSHFKNDTEIYDPVEILSLIAKVAAAAFAPFITAANPALLELNDFIDLQPWIDFSKSFCQESYYAWRKLRDEEETRFLGIIASRFLIREAYSIRNLANQGFCFTEKINRHQEYLWGNAAYGFAMTVIRAYYLSGWFSELRGVRPDYMGQGLVTGLLTSSYGLDRLGIFHKPVIEAEVTNKQERDLNQFGIMTLCRCPYTTYAAFYSCISVQKPKLYDKEIASANANLSSLLDPILCCSRFAHYIKVMMRDKLGKYTTTEEIRAFLQQWIVQYTAVIDNLSFELRSQYPLREARIEVREQMRKPGSYLCVIYLRPHYQIDEIEARFSLITELKN